MDILQPDTDKKSGNKKNFPVVALVAVLLLAGAGYWFFAVKGGFQKEQIKEGGMGTEFELCQSLDYDKTPRYGETYNDVFYKIAEIISTKDEKACSGLKENDKNLCLSEYYTFLILKLTQENKNASSYFDKFSQLGLLTDDELIVGKAYVSKDIKLCDNAKDIIEKNICKAIVAMDPQFCSFPEGISGAGGCLDIGGTEGTDKKCSSVEKKEAELLCLDSYYMAKSLRDRDIKGCSMISNDVGMFTKLYCSSMLSKEPKKEINNFYKENACYEKYAAYLAKKRNDISLCGKIPSKEGSNKIQYEDCIGQFK